MKILLTNQRVFITEGTIYPVKVVNGDWVDCSESEKQGYMVRESNCTYPQDYILIEVSEVPDYVQAGKYIYENGEFKLNPNWVAPPPTIEELTAKLSAVQEALDFVLMNA